MLSFIPPARRVLHARLAPATAWLSALLLCLFFAAPSRSADQEAESLSPAELAAVRSAEAARVAAIERVYGAVVAIYDNNRQGGGSGVIYDDSGLALTNHHVIAGAGSEGWGGLADGKLYRWKLIGTDPGGDVAIIQLTGKDAFPAAPLGDSDSVRVGDWAMAMGNPFLLAEDQRPTVTLGIVSGVKRYQGGSGLNLLVYGNCIQVDSSINPGNSGGPLFNIRGELIGINGRGSFKERGRVNVGLGYAISINQIKNFIPDLLATKIVQHGTLDAVFANRDGKVLCETINLDSAVAKLGLQLGDRLVEFERRKITSANQFTNLISTLPADWPAELVYERDGQEHALCVRLYALPYQVPKPEEPQPPPQKDNDDKEQDDSEQKDPDAPKEEDKDNPQEPPKIEVQPPRGFVMTTPGLIRDEEVNSRNCERIVGRWKSHTAPGSGGESSAKAFRSVDEVMKDGERVGQQEILLCSDGRFRLSYTDPSGSRACGFDGQEYWSVQPDGAAATLTRPKALLEPLIAQVAPLAAVCTTKPLAGYGKIILDGGDKAQHQVAYRLKTMDDAGEWFYVWLSVLDEHMQTQQVRLLKASPDINGDGRTGAVTYSDWRLVESLRWPFRRHLVRGIAEQVELEFVTTSIESVPQFSAADFAKPQANEK